MTEPLLLVYAARAAPVTQLTFSPASTGCPFDAFARLWLSDRVEFGGWVRGFGVYTSVRKRKHTLTH